MNPYIIIPAIALTACTVYRSPDEMRTFTPVAEYRIDRPAKEAGDCIYEKWADAQIFPATRVPYQGGYSFRLAGPDVNIVTLGDLVPDGDGSRMTIYPWINDPNDAAFTDSGMGAAVRECS